ncbi:hypothetical protein PSDI105340_15335 [Pseudoalteromonas distincta]
MSETIYLPQSYFPDIHQSRDIPHILYHYYQSKFNQTVHKTQNSIKAVLATIGDAKMLTIKAGDLLLLVSRITESIEGKRIEYRLSKCRSDHYHYQLSSTS